MEDWSLRLWSLQLLVELSLNIFLEDLSLTLYPSLIELMNYHFRYQKLDHQNPLNLFYKYCHYPDCWQIFVCLNDSFCWSSLDCEITSWCDLLLALKLEVSFHSLTDFSSSLWTDNLLESLSFLAKTSSVTNSTVELKLGNILIESEIYHFDRKLRKHI